MGKKNRVLFVDDETNVISAIRRAVIDEPFLASFAGSAKEALKIMEEQAVDVIVTDMRMPVMDGLTLLRIIKDKYPRTVRVVLSGYTQLSQVLATINQGEIFKFITKPWATDEELLPAVRQAIDYYNLQAERDILRDNLAKRNAAYQNILKTMEVKRTEERAEFLHLKDISGWVFSLWRKYAAAGASGQLPGQMNGFIDAAEEVYLTYLSQLPTVIDSKSACVMAADIADTCHNLLRIKALSPDEYIIRGNHKFLLMVFRILAYHLATDKEKIVCDLVAEHLPDGKRSLVFTAKITRTDAQAAAKFAVAAALMSKMGRPYGLNITADHDGPQITSVQISWQVEEGPSPGGVCA